eukprot:jgi/Tetstr1/434916/TSEL_023913.t1
MAAEVSGEEEALCRYCFEGREDGELISPCDCAGGQRYVHLACLRRWQRRVLVSQPTHPAFYEDDLRHQRCNVCTATFTCAPPTRGDLMASFTGPELAALIEPACIIASHPSFTAHLREQLADMPQGLGDVCGYTHWIDGVYLITAVDPDDGLMTVPLREQATLDSIRGRLDGRLSLSINRRRLAVAPGGSLAGVAAEELPAALAALSAPCRLVFGPLEPSGCSDDHIAAVNLSRRLDGREPPDPQAVRDAVEAAAANKAGAADVVLEHYLGGPCHPEDIACCVVLGGDGCGWTVVEELQEAVELVASRGAAVCQEAGEVRCGQPVRLHSLASAAGAVLNGQLGVALSFEAASGRWLVRLGDGSGRKVRPGNLEPRPGGGVLVFWGNAQWSRAQLLGEIARGSWGLCRAGVSELLAAPAERRPGLDGRLGFAPITEMTDDYVRSAQQQMEAIFAQVQLTAETPPPPPPGSPPPLPAPQAAPGSPLEPAPAEGGGEAGEAADPAGPEGEEGGKAPDAEEPPEAAVSAEQ